MIYHHIIILFSCIILSLYDPLNVTFSKIQFFIVTFVSYDTFIFTFFIVQHTIFIGLPLNIARFFEFVLLDVIVQFSKYTPLKPLLKGEISIVEFLTLHVVNSYALVKSNVQLSNIQ